MKIAWFTPFSTDSAIGRCGNLIAGELEKQAEVHIWYPDTEKPRKTAVRVHSFPERLRG